MGTRETTFVAGLDARLHHKDANIVLQCAYESKTPAPGAALAATASAGNHPGSGPFF